MHANVSILLGEGVKVLLEKDILGSDVGEDQVNLGDVSVGSAADNGTNDLKHGGNTSATSNHTKVSNHVWGVRESTLGTAKADLLANGEGGHVLGDVTLRVGLDQEVDIAGLVVTGDGGVGSYDFLGAAIGLRDISTNGDVLADGEAKDGSRGRELDAVTVVVARVRFGLQLASRKRATYMATLWEMMIFSLSSNPWKTSGFRTFLTSVAHRLGTTTRIVECWHILTELEVVVDTQSQGESNGVGRPFPLDDQGADYKESSGNVNVVDVVAREQRVTLIGSHFVVVRRVVAAHRCGTTYTKVWTVGWASFQTTVSRRGPTKARERENGCRPKLEMQVLEGGAKDSPPEFLGGVGGSIELRPSWWVGGGRVDKMVEFSPGWWTQFRQDRRR